MNKQLRSVAQDLIIETRLDVCSMIGRMDDDLLADLCGFSSVFLEVRQCWIGLWLGLVLSGRLAMNFKILSPSRRPFVTSSVRLGSVAKPS